MLLKVWRTSDSRCLESVLAHDDVVNTVAAVGFGGLVLTGSTNGTIKVWWREAVSSGDRTRHVLVMVLREGDDKRILGGSKKVGLPVLDPCQPEVRSGCEIPAANSEDASEGSSTGVANSHAC